MKCCFPQRVGTKGGDILCLFGSNYPHTCRPFPFSLFLSVSLVVRCCVAAFPFISSPASWFAMFLSVRVIVQPSALCEGASWGAFCPSASLTFPSYSQAFYLGFYTQIILLVGFIAEPAHSGHGQEGKTGRGWKWGNGDPGEGAATKKSGWS